MTDLDEGVYLDFYALHCDELRFAVSEKLFLLLSELLHPLVQSMTWWLFKFQKASCVL